jgi:uncharacterized protein YgiM (DUF1202 family)
MLAVMAMVLGASMAVYADNWVTCYTTDPGPIRQGAGKQFRVKMRIGGGVTLEANKDNIKSRYVPVNYNGTRGWFFTGYLREKSTGKKLSGGTKTPLKVLYRARTTNKQGMNLSTRMHLAAQLTSETIRRIPAYTVVPVYKERTTIQTSGNSRGRSITFAYVYYDDKFGWVAKSELERVD